VCDCVTENRRVSGGGDALCSIAIFDVLPSVNFAVLKRVAEFYCCGTSTMSRLELFRKSEPAVRSERRSQELHV
jgi:hypothetical protein